MRIFLAVFFSVLILGFVVGSAPTVLAQSPTAPDHTNCDAEFEDAIKARATMEAMREVEIAQTYILKPDSVLEYSCFFVHYGRIDALATDVFSDSVDNTDLFEDPPQVFIPQTHGSTFSQYHDEISQFRVTAKRFPPNQDIVQFGPQPPGGTMVDSRTGNVIGVVTGDSEFRFIFSNFGHTFAGGTYVSSDVPNGCAPMQLIWQFAKCVNFSKDDFRTLREWSVIDPRVVPSYAALSCNNAERYQQWADNYSATLAVQPGSAGGVEPVVSHLDLLDPDECANHTPINTGVQVYSQEMPDVVWPDAFCPSAGCYYNSGGACEAVIH